MSLKDVGSAVETVAITELHTQDDFGKLEQLARNNGTETNPVRWHWQCVKRDKGWHI